MNKFLKILSMVLSLAIFCMPLSAVADGGYGESAGNVQDTIADETVSSYVVSSTDLENATGTTSDGTTYGLYDSGEADHGKVYLIPSAGWLAIEKGRTGITYTYNSQNFTLFNEPLEADSHYILSYDHISFPENGSTLNEGARFSIAPTVEQFKNAKGTDWRDHPPASDNKWSSYSTIFYTGTQTTFNGKINTLNTHTLSYVDNVKLTKAIKLDVYNPGGSKLLVEGTGLLNAKDLTGYFAEMGQPLTVKIKDDGGYESIVEVIHNGVAVEETNGEYYIPAVTGEVSVKFGLNINEIEENAGVTMNGNTVYANVGDTYVKFLARFGMPKNVIKFFDAEGADLTDFLKPMANNMTAKVVYDGNELRNYNVKYKGDLTGDGKLTVSDVFSVVNGIINDSFEDSVQADINDSGRVTVSDVVKLRGEIMNQGKEVKQFKVLAIGNSFSINATKYLAQVANAAGYDVEDIVVGNVWHSGCSLEQHADFSTNEKNEYHFYYWKNSLNQKTITPTTLKTALEFEDWDYITIQQASHLAGLYNSYQPYADQLLDYINKYKTNPDVKIGWHMTWAYPQTPPAGYEHHQGFADYNSDQMTMYNAIVDASTNFASSEKQIELVIPSGTVAQNLREKVGDVITRDQFHMNESYGCLMLSLAWVKTITGKDIAPAMYNAEISAIIDTGVSELADRGVTVTADELKEYIVKSINDAIANPSTVTK